MDTGIYRETDSLEGVRKVRTSSSSPSTPLTKPSAHWAWVTDLEGAIKVCNTSVRHGRNCTPHCRDTLGVIVAEEWDGILTDAIHHGEGQGTLHLRLASNEVIQFAATALCHGGEEGTGFIAWAAHPMALDDEVESAADAGLLLDTLLNHIPDRIFFKDIQSHFVRWSRSFEDLFKLAEGESLRGCTDFDHFADSHAHEAFEDERRIMETGQPVVGKLEMENHSDGRITWALTTKMPWYDRDGRLLGTFGISKSVTALKEAEARLEAAHKSLLEASRSAGMAEVACDVLHNVGNVLNSVNVSCSVVRERLERSKLTSLSKLAALLDSKKDQLAEYLTTDTRGAKVPEYLSELATHLGDERGALLSELDQLGSNVEHIKEIISLQQDYANRGGMVEEVSLEQLIEDAFRINAGALLRHRVEVQRDLAQVPNIVTVKHKVLQILVNLIRNAKYAVSEAEIRDGWLKITLLRADEDRVVLRVSDNGVGIPAKNLTRIFNHGFTTRKEGHGFGLHSAALAAKELGGSLQVSSEGAGQGATFTLDLPMRYQPPRS